MNQEQSIELKSAMGTGMRVRKWKEAKAKKGRGVKELISENGAVPKPVKLPPMQLETIEVTLVGDSPLLCHKFSEKARKEMEDKNMGKAKQAKPPRNPEQEYESSIYRDDGGNPCFPASAFKRAAVDACSHISGITKVEARGGFHVIGNLVRIDGEPEMQTDIVRIGMGTSTNRYRAVFKSWSVTLKIRFNSSVLTLEEITNLLSVAGFAIGVGEWRPQKNGSHGMWHVG